LKNSTKSPIVCKYTAGGLPEFEALSKLGVDKIELGINLGSLIDKHVNMKVEASNGEMTRTNVLDALATELGITTQTVQRYLSGDIACPTIDTMAKVARYLGGDIMEFIATAEADGCVYENKAIDDITQIAGDVSMSKTDTTSTEVSLDANKLEGDDCGDEDPEEMTKPSDTTTDTPGNTPDETPATIANGGDFPDDEDEEDEMKKLSAAKDKEIADQKAAFEHEKQTLLQQIAALKNPKTGTPTPKEVELTEKFNKVTNEWAVAKNSYKEGLEMERNKALSAEKQAKEQLELATQSQEAQVEKFNQITQQPTATKTQIEQYQATIAELEKLKPVAELGKAHVIEMRDAALKMYRLHMGDAANEALIKLYEKTEDLNAIKGLLSQYAKTLASDFGWQCEDCKSRNAKFGSITSILDEDGVFENTKTSKTPTDAEIRSEFNTPTVHNKRRN